MTALSDRHVSELKLDRLGVVLASMVAFLGAVCHRYAATLLDEASGRRRFLDALNFTVFTAWLMMISDHLALIVVSWSATSFGLHRLLTHYPDRPAAMRTAWTKFAISRLGDLALLGALVAIWSSRGTLVLSEYLAAVTHPGPADVTAALLVCVATWTKSAQAPFHTWLPETMDSPTPVSALMHAGLVNAGGVLAIKFAPLLVRVPAALMLLTIVGCVTLVIGTLARWAQTDVKRGLAWSTVSQMGFMILQCGQGAFGAASLHVIGHAFYKAHAFLGAGTAQPETVAVRPRARDLVTGLLVAVAVEFIWPRPTDPLATRLALMLACGYVAAYGASAFRSMVQGRSTSAALRYLASKPRLVERAALPIGLALAGAFAISCHLLVHGLTPSPVRSGPAVSPPALGELVAVVTLLGLAAVHLSLPALLERPAGRAWKIHAAHGFYFGLIVDRWIATFESEPAVEEVRDVTVA